MRKSKQIIYSETIYCYSAIELATRLKISVSLFYTFFRNGKISVKKVGTNYYITEKNLHLFLSSGFGKPLVKNKIKKEKQK